MNANPPREAFGDAITRPFWEAAEQRRLLIQRCEGCGQHQFYPRRFCRRCHRETVTWVEASGVGRVYTMTRIWHSEDPALPAPYVNALVELDEGPRLFTTLVGSDCAIGQRVKVAWRERSGAPPLPVFEPAGEYA
jgi:hypothetical protein